MLGNYTDSNLWDEFKKGSKVAFSEIYQKYAASLLSYGSRITSDNSLVEDCVQDLFIEIWASRERLSRTTSIKFYLFKALRFKIYRNINRATATDPLDGYLAVLESASGEDLMIEADGESLQLRQLKESFEKLPLRQKEAINLRYFHCFSNDEVSQIMGISYNSACKCIYAGLKTLKGNLRGALV